MFIEKVFLKKQGHLVINRIQENNLLEHNNKNF